MTLLVHEQHFRTLNCLGLSEVDSLSLGLLKQQRHGVSEHGSLSRNQNTKSLIDSNLSKLTRLAQQGRLSEFIRAKKLKTRILNTR